MPNESTTGAATTALTLDLPNVSAVRTESQTRLGRQIDRDGDKVRSVTWTAAPNGGIPVDQFDVFRIAVKLPDADSVSFPATQTYADGDGGEVGSADGTRRAPSRSIPRRRWSLAAGSTPKPAHHPRRPTPPRPPATPAAQAAAKVVDNTSRILAGAALLVGALGVGLALIVRRP